MAKFTIVIKGIAIVYHRDDDVWKVILPFAGCHRVLFSYDNQRPRSFAQGGVTIEFKADDPVSEFAEGNDYDTFLDLTFARAHSKGIRRRGDWHDKGVLMTIPNASFSVFESNNSRYRLVDPNNTVVHDFDRMDMGYYGVAEIDARELTMTVTGYEEPWIFAQDTELLFDNECHGDEVMTDQFGDIKLVYNILQDRNSPGSRFDTRRHQSDLPEPGKAQGRNGNPKPDLEDGLPCHMVVVGSPGDLP